MGLPARIRREACHLCKVHHHHMNINSACQSCVNPCYITCIVLRTGPTGTTTPHTTPPTRTRTRQLPPPTMFARSCEKDMLTIAAPVQAPPTTRSLRPQTLRPKCCQWWTAAVFVVALLASSFFFAFLPSAVLERDWQHTAIVATGKLKLCPQSDDVLFPESHARLWKSLGRDFDDDGNDAAFVTRAVAWLGGAVRIPYVYFLLLNALVLVLVALWHHRSHIIMLNQVRSRTMVWVPLVRTSVGRLLGRSMTTSNMHSLSRA